MKSLEQCFNCALMVWNYSSGNILKHKKEIKKKHYELVEEVQSFNWR